MLILQIYVTTTALAVVGLIISILTKVVTSASKSPPINQILETEDSKSAWWVEVMTAQPRCIYYFGPFSSKKQAEIPQIGYVDDLEAEGARGITTQIKWCKPRELTICQET